MIMKIQFSFKLLDILQPDLKKEGNKVNKKKKDVETQNYKEWMKICNNFLIFKQ